MTRPVIAACLALATCFLLPSLAAAVEVDAGGARKLSPLPPPGVHPRVLFTAADLPDIRRRLTQTAFGKVFGPIVRREAERLKPPLAAFAALDLSKPAPEVIETHWRADEGRNIRWGLVALDAVVRGDAAQKALMAKGITNYSRLILASKALAAGGDVEGRAGEELRNRLTVWKTDRFDLGVCWLFGGAGMALAYDMLYDDMTPGQREVVRGALAAGTRGRQSYGMGAPRGRGVSNHYGYHGDLAVMLAAIEGEEGYDAAAYKRIEQVMVDYFEVGFTPAGACHEDLYGPNVGLREGSRALLVLARRGKNVFGTGRYRNFVRYFAHECEPFRDGAFVGGASGGPGLPYPTSITLAKYMRPTDPVADYNWRWLMGDDYRRNLKWQSWLDFALFGMDWDGKRDEAPTLAETDMKLSAFYPRRGKLIARSDWTPQALCFHLDARPDAFVIGHDTVDRGTFVLSALGRAWAVHASWHHFRNSSDYNLVHVDGKAQAWKAPSVRFLHQADAGAAVVGVADLKYAYDWQWSPPWPTKDQEFPAPWRPELSDPRDLGWPDDPDWLPHKLYGEPGVGYVGSYMWRRPHNPMQKAFRTAVMVRGAHPYVLVVDDVRKDAAAHDYGWYMQVAGDLELASHTGADVILKDPAADRRLLVRACQAGPPSAEIGVRLEEYEANKDRSGKPVPGKRLIVSTRAVEPGFKMLLFPHREGQELPRALWDEGRTRLTIASAGRKDAFAFTVGKDGRTRVTLARNGKTVLAVE